MAEQKLQNADGSLLDRKIGRWKKELLDTGRRNKMIHYRETKRTTLRILEPDPAELFNQLAISEKELTFQRPVSRDSDFRTYAMLALLDTLNYSLPVQRGDIKTAGTIGERGQALKNMRSKAKLAQEEQGINILYLSFGFIIWRENTRANSPWMKSPLLMMPAALGLKSLNAPYTLKKYDDEIEVNPTLAHLFHQDFGIDLPVFELKNRNSFEEYMEAVGEIADKKGWKLVREVSLGLVSFLKISMYHDLNNHRDLIEKSPVIQAIAGNPADIGNLPGKAVHYNFDESDPSKWHEVVDADSSQEEAILLSRLGVSFVMQGPPGTGKSQTITNIIAEALADGKKILFVSEKSAALQVVLKRLKEVQLDDFCLSLHNYKANKKEIIDNIGANLSVGREYADRTAAGDLAELFRDRRYLDEYAGELHRIIEPLGESVYSAFGKLSGLCGADTVDFRLDDPAKVTREQYSSWLYAAGAFEKALRGMDGALTDNPWAGTAAISSGRTFLAEMEAACGGLAAELYELEAEILDFNSACGTGVTPSWQGIARGIAEAEEVLDLPLFPAHWTDAKRLAGLREQALREEKEAREAGNHFSVIKRLTEEIERGWKRDQLAVTVGEMHRIYAGERKRAAEGDGRSMADYAGAALEKIQTVIRDVRNIESLYREAASLLRFDKRGRIADILMAARILSALRDAPDMDTSWFDVRKNPDLTAMLAEIREHWDSCRKKTDLLLETWEPSALQLDAAGMLARFKTEYTGMFRKLKGAYKADMKQLRLLARTVGKKTDEASAIAFLQLLEEINYEKKWFSDNETRIKTAFPNHYKGPDTDWEKISEGLQTALYVACQFPFAGIPVEVIEAIRDNIRSLQQAAEIRRLADRLKEEKVSACICAVQEAVFPETVTPESSLPEDILPAVLGLQKEELEYQAAVSRLNKARTGPDAVYDDLRQLITQTEGLKKELEWFNRISPAGAGLSVALPGEDPAVRDIMKLADETAGKYSGSPDQEKAAELAAAFQGKYAGSDTDWQSVVRDIDTVAAYLSGHAEKLPREFLNVICGNPGKREEARRDIRRMKERKNGLNSAFRYFSQLFPDIPMEDKPLHEVADKYDSCRNRFDELNKWLDYVETRGECDALGLGSFTSEIAAKNNSVKDVRAAFEKGFYTQWLSAVMDDVPAVQTFRKRVHERRLEEFVKLDQKQFELSRSRIRERIISAFPSMDETAAARSERRILLHEMEKKRRIMPLRKLFHEIPGLLLTLKPCLMMSPLSVAYFLNAEEYHFDMVIFDEASQIFPQDAIGAIFRADQVIIAGDTKQLPPTDFFSAGTDNPDEYDDDDREEEMYDSILEEAAEVLPNRTLLWHYRSRHEHLIAFSNKEIYRGNLVTFPGSRISEPDTGVEFIFEEEGCYEGGGRNCNIPEAKRCVQLVKEHIDRHPDRSLGIIAFSEKQQQAVAFEIQRFRERNPGYEDFFAEGKDEEFFVKNLENVQGDERDTILFSIGYARTREQKAAGRPMSMRFGPLGISGGERRLNVAITRARVNVKLVSSILPSDIDLNRTGSEGVRMLRSYMEFAINGDAALASSDWRHAPDDFADSVCRFICGLGYRARQYVGCSGYRLDIAVEHPAAENMFIAGIECDGVSYVSARTARDRDRLRRSVLGSMGWNLYRVWSAQWYHDPETERQKLAAFLEEALEKSNENMI